jgi:hypothetical protein
MEWLAAAALSANLLDSYLGREDAKKAMKSQRKRDAWNQLIQAASGGRVSGTASPAEAPPSMNIGGALSQFGSTLAASQSADQAENYRQQLLGMEKQQATDSANYRTVSTELENAKRRDALQLGQQGLALEKAKLERMAGAKEPEPLIAGMFKPGEAMKFGYGGEQNDVLNAVNAIRVAQGQEPLASESQIDPLLRKKIQDELRQRAGIPAAGAVDVSGVSRQDLSPY